MKQNTTTWTLALLISVGAAACTEKEPTPSETPVASQPETQPEMVVDASGLRGGVVINASLLPAAQRVQLQQDIAAFKQQRPEVFEQLATIRAEVPDLDANKRGRFAPIMPKLFGLGADALLPMLEELAFDAAPRGDLNDTAWIGWRASLLEATGKLRSPQAEPVLRAALEHTDDEVVTRAAAQAYAKLNTPAVATWLANLADVEHPQRLARIEGMGHCRQVVIVDKLGAMLDAQPQVAEARALAGALGVAGSKWAWETEVIKTAGDEQAVRSTSAQHLVKAYAAYDDAELRTHIRRAILMIDAPNTLDLIESAKQGADAALVAELEGLAERVENNPLNRYEGGLPSHLHH